MGLWGCIFVSWGCRLVEDMDGERTAFGEWDVHWGFMGEVLSVCRMDAKRFGGNFALG